jgi:GT2 family glycosyltransferase
MMPEVKDQQPEINIVVLNWNGLEDTTECLESLKNIAYLNYKIIVVDNGSDVDETVKLKERFSGCAHFIRQAENSGFGGGANIGIKYAQDNFAPDYFLILNNDTVVAPDFLDQMIKLAESDSSVGIVGPVVCSYDSPDLIQCIGARISVSNGQTLMLDGKQPDSGQYGQQKEVDLVLACMLLSAAVVGRVGYFNDKYFIYYDDTEYCVRTKKAGYKIVFAPEAKIWHKSGQSAGKVVGLWDYYQARNRIWFVRRNATATEYRCFLRRHFINIDFWLRTGSLLYRRKIKQFVAVYRGTRDGLLNSESGSKFYR